MHFVSVTAISISTSETQQKLTQYQHHRKKNNWKILHPVDQAFGRVRSGKTTWKGKIQWIAGAKHKLLEKEMKTPSSLVIDLLTSISNCFYSEKYTKKAVSQVPHNRKLVLSHVPPNLDLSIWSISTNLSYFFCLLWATGLVVFNWNLLHNLFHFEDGMQYIHVHFAIFAVCWNWFLVSK